MHVGAIASWAYLFLQPSFEVEIAHHGSLENGDRRGRGPNLNQGS
jgi:hypothetical protein